MAIKRNEAEYNDKDLEGVVDLVGWKEEALGVGGDGYRTKSVETKIRMACSEDNIYSVSLETV